MNCLIFVLFVKPLVTNVFLFPIFNGFFVLLHIRYLFICFITFLCATIDQAFNLNANSLFRASL